MSNCTVRVGRGRQAEVQAGCVGWMRVGFPQDGEKINCPALG